VTSADRLRHLLTQSRLATRPAADVLAAARAAVDRYQPTMLETGRTGMSSIGRGLEKAGESLQAGSQSLERKGEVSGLPATSWTDKAVSGTLRALGFTGRMLGGVSRLAGRVLQDSADPVARAGSRMLTGGMGLLSNAADAVSIPASELKTYRTVLVWLANEQKARFEALEQRLATAKRHRRRQDMLDQLVVGGVVLSSLATGGGTIPPEIEAAYLAAYPGLAAKASLSETLQQMSASELPGFAAGLKGKLFELQFVEHLNAGQLPDGYTAELAVSATQPGWDLRIVGVDGSVAEVLSAKATESAGYVREALERYPGIDVVTTSEVYAQLVAQGLADQVRDGGMENAALEASIDQALGAGADGLSLADFAPSGLGLAVIALSVFMDSSLSREAAAEAFGDRTGRAGVSAAAGQAVLVVSQLWWLALIGGVGVHWLSTQGRGRREQHHALVEVVGNLAMINHRAGRDLVSVRGTP
jgi:hypothetical protein